MTDNYFVISGQAMRAAMACAAKNDTRRYLNGVFLDAKRGVIVSTNSHHLYQHDLESFGSNESVILQPVKVGARVQRVIVRLLLGGQAEMILIDKDGNEKKDVIGIINADYPDVARLVPNGRSEKGVDQIGFNAVYLALINKVFPRQRVALTFQGATGATVIREVLPTGPSKSGFMLLMPCQL